MMGLRGLLKKHIPCIVAIALLIAPIIPQTPVEAKDQIDRRVFFELQLPEETGNADRIVAIMKLYIPDGVEIHGFSTGLCFPLPYFECTADSIIAGSEFSRDCIGGVEETITFHYENAYVPLTAGEYILFAVQFDIREDTPAEAYHFQTVTEEAYTSVFDHGICIGTRDVEYLDTTGSVYAGIRFKVTPNAVDLTVGQSILITPNKPLDNAYVQNRSIAEYKNGKITALSAGNTYAIFTADTGETVMVKVVVTIPGGKPDPVPPVSRSITSDVYSVTDTRIGRVPAGTAVSTFLKGFPDREFIRVYRSDGQTPVQGQESIGTGYVVQLIVNGIVKDTKTAMITGDINGDGKISAADYVNVKFSVLKKQVLTGMYSVAADVNGDGKVTAADYVYIKFHVLKKTQIIPQ